MIINKKKKKLKLNIPRILLHAFFVLFSLSFIIPLLLVLAISITDPQILKTGYTLFPSKISFEAYNMIFANPQKIINAYKVTIFSALVGTSLSLIVCSMIGYALSRNNFKIKSFVTFFIYFTMLFGGGLVPSYILITRYLHLGDTLWVYIFPSRVAPFFIIVFTTFFRGLPQSLVESAKIDGASELRIYWNIIVPLSKPVIATIGFMTVLGRWNDWYTSLIYIRAKPDLYLLQYLLQKIFRDLDFITKMMTDMQGGPNTDALKNAAPLETMQFAMAIIATGPMLILFPFFQKYLARGLTIGAVKG